MAKIILITGGSRSGKSDYALRLAGAVPGRRAFVATCPPMDEEMRERIRKHQQARSESDWETIEETIDLRKAIEKTCKYDVALVDCLTLWINNLIYETEQKQQKITEEIIIGLCGKLVEACREHPGDVILVTNEVGMGIVPDNPLARLFRDLAGRCNQIMAAAADEVILIVCGLPLKLK